MEETKQTQCLGTEIEMEKVEKNGSRKREEEMKGESLLDVIFTVTEIIYNFIEALFCYLRFFRVLCI